jgi:hypothetical protein
MGRHNNTMGDIAAASRFLQSYSTHTDRVRYRKIYSHMNSVLLLKTVPSKQGNGAL